jgi:hypothetical protein
VSWRRSEQVQVGDGEPLHFLRLEFCEPSGIGAALRQGHGCPKVRSQSVQDDWLDGLPWVEAVGDVDVPRSNVIPDERRGTPSHIGSQDRGSLPKLDAPPRFASGSDVPQVNVPFLGFAKEAHNYLTVVPIQNIKVNRQANDDSQMLSLSETFASMEELPGLRNGAKEHTSRHLRQVPMR